MAKKSRNSLYLRLCWIVAAILAMALLTASPSNARFSFTQIDVPGVPNGINDAGQIVGTFTDNLGRSHGFLDSGGIITQIDAPGGNPCLPDAIHCLPGTAANGTEASGINDAGQIVGIFDEYSFLDSGGIFTRIDAPGAPITVAAAGINSAGQIAGSIFNGTGEGFHGFLDTTQIDVPGAAYTMAYGINDAGEVVGTFADNLNNAHGFLDRGGSFTQIDAPGASSTQANGINDAGEIVGTFADNLGNLHGFLDRGGSFSQIDWPGASSTQANGINDAGQIVGSSSDNLGFLATESPVPEPATLTLLGISLAGLVTIRRSMASSRPRHLIQGSAASSTPLRSTVLWSDRRAGNDEERGAGEIAKSYDVSHSTTIHDTRQSVMSSQPRNDPVQGDAGGGYDLVVVGAGLCRLSLTMRQERIRSRQNVA